MAFLHERRPAHDGGPGLLAVPPSAVALSAARLAAAAPCAATLSAAALVAIALAATVALAQHADPAFPVVDARVYTSALVGGTLYVGGQFAWIGPNTGSLACVDAASGAAFPFARVDGTVYAIVPDGAGGWFVGGEFASVSGVPRANLARVRGDGSLDPWWNPGADAPVRAIAPAPGYVFVGGDFLAAGGQPRRHVAQLNLGDGAALAWNADADSAVNALLLDGSTLWLGGRFDHVGGEAHAKLAAVSAGTGAPLPFATPIASPAGQWPNVRTLALAAGVLYVGGQFTSIGGQPRTNLAALDAGSGLANAFDPFAGGYGVPNAILPLGATVLLGGAFASAGGSPRGNLAEVSAATGAATSWNPGANGEVKCLRMEGGRLLVGGSFTTAGGAPRANLAEIDLSSGAADAWDPGAHGLVLAIGGRPAPGDSSRIAIGGGRMSLGALRRRGLAAIDLASGQLTNWNPDPDSWVRSMSREGGTLYLCGNFTSIGGAARAGLAAVDLASGQPTAWTPPAANGPVKSVFAHGGTVYAGGGFTAFGATPRVRLAAFDATTGALTGWAPAADNGVNVVSAKDGRVFAGGLFTQLAGAARAHVGAVDSATAAPLPWAAGTDNVVDVLVPDDAGRVYVGGWFTQLGGASRGGIGRVAAATGALDAWDPQASAPVEAIVTAGATVVAGGLFTTIGGGSVSRAAKLDVTSGLAQAWDPGLYYLPWTLQVVDDVVYAGGDLYSAGALPLSGLAKLFPADLSPPVPQVLTPNGGEFIGNETPYLVTWTVADDQRVPFVDLELALGSTAGPWLPIATALPNTGAYEWVTPNGLVTEPAGAHAAAAPAGSRVLPPAWLRVVARDLAGNTASDLSDSPFSLAGTGGVPQLPTLVSLSISPNPIRDDGRVSFGLPEPARVRAGLFDLAGREIARLTDRDYPPGRHALALPAALAPGVYVVRASLGGRSLARKLVVLF